MAGPSAQVLALKINGIFSDPNSLSEVPPGITLAQCANVVLDRDSILQARRGFGQYGVSPTGTGAITDLYDYKDTILVHGQNGTLYRDGGNGLSWTAYSGTYLAPNGATKLQSFQSNKNLYLATNAGVFKLDAVANTPQRAGAPAGLGGEGTTTGSTGFMSTNTNVAYRVVWGYRDANDNLILGAPGDRIVVTNTTGGDRNVSLTFFIPQQITTDWFYQIYRSGPSATANDAPDDELQLVYDGIPTAGNISAGLITVVDSTPNDLRGVTIYTAPSLSTQGILGSNTEPPFATAVCTFQNTAFYGNTRTKHTFNFSLTAVGAPDGLQVGDTITISDGVTTFVLTGAAVENAAAGQFLVQAALTPAENIDVTARSIVKVINTLTSNTLVDAYYSPGCEDTPGNITLVRITLSAVPFTVVSSRSTPWRPVLPVSGSTYNNTSRNEERPNRVYFSKTQQPEAVPILNFFDIGSSEESIQALVPLRAGVMVLKADGIYRITGANGQFSVEAVDQTVRIIAPNSVALLSNQVFFFSSQGIVAASETGTQIVSRPVEADILTLSSNLYPNFADVTFAVGYDSDRKYILWTVSTESDTFGTQAFVYNVITQAWTRWTKPAQAAIVRQADDTLYLAGPEYASTTFKVYKERKSFSLTDQADEEYPVAIVSALADVVTLVSTVNIEVGYTLSQNISQSRVTEIISSTQVRLASVEDWVAGDATVFRPIDVFAQSNPFDAGTPATMKHWADCSLLFRATDFTDVEVGFAADTTPEELGITVVRPRGTGGWGAFPWGLRPWGVSQSARARLRAAVPKLAMRSNWLQVSWRMFEAFSQLDLAGVSLTFSTMSSRQKGASRQ